MDDLISRSALLEELKEQHDYIMEDPEVGKTMKWCEAVCFHRMVETVESAPTVDAEKVFEAAGLVKEAFDMAKSSLVPVVRCEKCALWDHEHIEMYQHSTEHPELQARFAECRRWSTWSTCFMTRSDDYCSEAKRRADE